MENIKINSAKVAMFGYKNNMNLEELANYLEVTVCELNQNIFSNGPYDLKVIKRIENKLKIEFYEIIKNNKSD